MYRIHLTQYSIKQPVAFNLMDMKQSLFLSIGVLLTFAGMVLLRVVDLGGGNAQSSFMLMVASIISLVAGTYYVTDVIRSLSDSFLFSFFKKMEKTRAFSSFNWMVAIVALVVISILGFMSSDNMPQASLGAIIFSGSFPLLVLIMRYRKRVKLYRSLSDDVESEYGNTPDNSDSDNDGDKA